ncbi:MAG: hypothetical protein DRI97_12145, partial [Bacteroidetes bacterium]
NLSGMLFLSIIWYTILGLAPMEEPRSSIEWHWEDEFSAAEKGKVEDWLNSVTGAVESTLGVYPFTMHYYIHRRNGSSEPVPWANTRRHYVQGVDFHIDPSFSLQAFLDDWTAPHEISHLSIPYLGREQSWFAEGYASFMQYQIMQELGICSEQELGEIYAEKIERVRPYYDRDQDFVAVSRELKSRNRYSVMYWGGASYFMQIDTRLKEEHGMDLTDFITKYQLCCRLKDESFEELIESWDRLLGEPLFSELLQNYQRGPASEVLNAASITN